MGCTQPHRLLTHLLSWLLLLLLGIHPLQAQEKSPSGSSGGGKADAATSSQDDTMDSLEAGSVGAGPESQAPGAPPALRLMTFLPDPRVSGMCKLEGWRGEEERCVDRVQRWDGWTLPPNYAESSLLRSRTEGALKALSHTYFMLWQDAVARWRATPPESGQGIALGLLQHKVYRPPAPSSTWEAWGPTTVRLPETVFQQRDLARFNQLREAVSSNISLPPPERWITKSLCEPLLYGTQSGERLSSRPGSPLVLCSDSFSKYFKMRGRADYRIGHLFDTEPESLEGPFLEQLYPVHLSRRPPWPSQTMSVPPGHLPVLKLAEPNKINMLNAVAKPSAETLESRRRLARVGFDLLHGAWTEVADRLSIAMLRYGPRAFSAVQLRTLGALALMNSTAPRVGDDAAVRPENAGDLGNTDEKRNSQKKEQTQEELITEDLTDPDWLYAFNALPPGLVDSELKGWVDRADPLRSGSSENTRYSIQTTELLWSSQVSIVREWLRGRAWQETLHPLVAPILPRLTALLVCHEVFPGDESSSVRATCLVRAEQRIKQGYGSLELELTDALGRKLRIPLRLTSLGLPELVPSTLRLYDWEPLLYRLDPLNITSLRESIYGLVLGFMLQELRISELQLELEAVGAWPMPPEEPTLPPELMGPRLPEVIPGVLTTETLRFHVRSALNAWEWLWAEESSPLLRELPFPTDAFALTQQLTEATAAWFEPWRELERPPWLNPNEEVRTALRNAQEAAEELNQARARRQAGPEADRVYLRELRRSWNTLHRYVSASRAQLPDEWPTSFHPEALTSLGLEYGGETPRLRRSALYARVVPILLEFVQTQVTPTLSPLYPEEQGVYRRWVQAETLKLLVRELWRSEWETPYPALAHRENLSRSSRFFEAVLPPASELANRADLESCASLPTFGASTWDRWHCQVERTLKSREVPQSMFGRYRQALHLATLRALTSTLGESGQRTYRRWIFQRFHMASLDNLVKGRSSWSPETLESAVETQWDQFLNLHGLKGRREEPPQLPSVNPLAVCGSPTATNEQRYKEISVRQVVVDVLFEAPANPGLEPARVLWEARDKLPFIAIDGSARRFGSSPEGDDDALQVEPLFRIPALKEPGAETPKGAAAWRMVYRARWRLWSGWHMFWSVAERADGFVPVLRTGAICQDTLLMQTDLEPTLLRWALLKDNAPTRPLQLGLDYSEEEEQKLREQMEKDRLERLAAQEYDEETGTVEANRRKLEDRVLAGAREGRTDAELVQLGYASQSPLQQALQQQLRQLLRDWLARNPQPLKPGAPTTPDLLMAFDVSWFKECRPINEDGLYFFFRRSQYLRTSNFVRGDPDYCCFTRTRAVRTSGISTGKAMGWISGGHGGSRVGWCGSLVERWKGARRRSRARRGWRVLRRRWVEGWGVRSWGEGRRSGGALLWRCLRRVGGRIRVSGMTGVPTPIWRGSVVFVRRCWGRRRVDDSLLIRNSCISGRWRCGTLITTCRTSRRVERRRWRCVWIRSC